MVRNTKYTFVCFVLLLAGINHSALGQKIEIIKFQDLTEMMEAEESKVKVINFWATWCKPCIAELPIFEKIETKYDTSDVRVLLVNLDFPSELERVKAFIQKRGIKSEVKVLDEPDYDSWINKIDEGWSGAIPATFLIRTSDGEGKLCEGNLNAEFLETKIENLLYY